MYTLYHGDTAYSSWSLRGWLLLDAFGIAFTARSAHMRTPEFEALRAEMAPSRLVPALAIEEDGQRLVVWDSLAMAETLAERHPAAGIWPADPALRATARSLAAEMHSGLTALRGACPMNFYHAYAGFEVTPEVQADLDRLAELWAHARAMTGQGAGRDPWLFGAFSAADAFFAPVASRIHTYDLKMGEADAAYARALLAHPSVARWRAMALADGYVQPQYFMDLPEREGA